jgi:hypothetical protein
VAQKAVERQKPHSEKRTYQDVADLRCCGSGGMREILNKSPTHRLANLIRGKLVGWSAVLTELAAGV